MNLANQILKTKQFFKSRQTYSLDFRLAMLNRLEELIVSNSEYICQSLKQDLHKPKQEALISEIAVTLEEVRYAKKNLTKWATPKRLCTPISLLPAKSRTYFNPKGVALIISPWNYPFQLAVAPLVGAIAAGNCAIIKPSELSVNTEDSLARLFAQYFPEDYISVIKGGVAETTQLLEMPFDHIFFTGSTAVGKIIMQAAAKKLVPVTLELGGKSPAIVTASADLDLAARRIVWGKYYNAGQTCVAPDYVYAQEECAQSLLAKMQTCIRDQFGEHPQKSDSFGRIINAKHFSRLVALLKDDNICVGGQHDEADLYIAPTILSPCNWQSTSMQEEIFGPILPVLTFKDIEEVKNELDSRPHPLSAYMFTQSSSEKNLFTQQMAFGGGCINDVVVHLGSPYLPFGGVGESGFGHYHGIYGFKTFSHEKTVLHRSGLLDVSARYAPYSEKKLKFLRRLFKT